MIKIPKADLLAKISFIMLIFFSFFPSEIPFQSTLQERGEIASSNVINQLIYSSLFLLSFLSFLSKPNEIFINAKKEKALIIFLLWALLTIIWSDYRDVSFKRWFQIFTYYFVILVYLTYEPSLNKILMILKKIVYPYLIISLLVVLAIPEAKDPAFGTWRGMSATKNNFGQLTVVATVFAFIIYHHENHYLKKNIALLFIFLAIALVIGSLSSTSYISLFVFFSLSFLFYLKNKIFVKIGAEYFLFFLTLIIGIITFILIFIFLPQIPDLIEGIFGKDEAFYDRGKLWKVMIWNISQHPLIGCGYQGFWVVESPKIQLLYTSFVWLPIQAHNGYLDLINEVGLIGLLLFLSIIIRYIIISYKKKNLDLWVWFVILPLIMNVTETTLFRPAHKTNVFLLLGYLVKILITKSKNL